MTSIITYADGGLAASCFERRRIAAGVSISNGIVTTWRLVGQNSIYQGSLVTDGYQIVASFSWPTYLGDNSEIVTFVPGKISVIGTCIETLDLSGAPLAAAVTTEGNYAICHWLYFEKGAVSSTTNRAYFNQMRGGVDGEWGETVYLNEAEWASAGSRITGESIGLLGTPIAEDYGFARSGFASTQTTPWTFTQTGVYTMSWYQPKYAATYGKNSLRRYQGGSEDADKVRGYCVGPRNIDDTTINSRINAATQTGKTGVVTLNSASGLVAGAIAFGMASLAF